MRLWLVPLLIVAACGGERARDPDDSSTSATATDAATDGVATTDTTLNDTTLAADSATPSTKVFTCAGCRCSSNGRSCNKRSEENFPLLCMA